MMKSHYPFTVPVKTQKFDENGIQWRLINGHDGYWISEMEIFFPKKEGKKKYLRP